jgi:hypothetical protein
VSKAKEGKAKACPCPSYFKFSILVLVFMLIDENKKGGFPLFEKPKEKSKKEIQKNPAKNQRMKREGNGISCDASEGVFFGKEENGTSNNKRKFEQSRQAGSSNPFAGKRQR